MRRRRSIRTVQTSRYDYKAFGSRQPVRPLDSIPRCFITYLLHIECPAALCPHLEVGQMVMLKWVKRKGPAAGPTSFVINNLNYRCILRLRGNDISLSNVMCAGDKSA